MFNKWNYKVAIATELKSSRMRRENFNSDIGDESNLRREDMAEPDWMSSILVSKKTRQRSATNQIVEVAGTIILHVRMEEALLSVVLGTVKKLAVFVFLAKSYIDKFVKVMLPAER